MPVGGDDYPRTYQEFRDWFPDDQACLDYLGQLRWPRGFECPRCGSGGFWRISQRRLWMCAECGLKTSVTAGTIFHRTHSPLSSWFAAVWFVTSQKTGMSAQGLQRVLGFGSYETAWAWLHKLRRAMVRPDRERLAGIVEVDQSFIGGKTAGHEGGAGAGTNKVPVTIAVERDEQNRLGRIRLEIADRPASTEMVEFTTEVAEPGATIRTDGANLWHRLPALGYTHEPTAGITATDPDSVTPGVHLVASLLKRWIAGTLHHRISLAHMPYYLDEFTFRFNRRKSKAPGLLFYRLLQQAVDTDPHPLDELIGR
ncbi:MAG TPA: IS1595 family transposase [Jiangellaceae bacterium]|nr:IS1595 family transposase [Jiangellaceae bacterium]